MGAIQIKLDDELHRELKIFCAKEKTTQVKVVEQALTEYFAFFVESKE